MRGALRLSLPAMRTLSRGEHGPADVVAAPLVLEHEGAHLLGQPVPLPRALAGPGGLLLSGRGRRHHRLEGVRRCPEVVLGDVGDARRLPGRVRGEARSPTQWPGGAHALAALRRLQDREPASLPEYHYIVLHGKGRAAQLAQERIEILEGRKKAP